MKESFNKKCREFVFLLKNRKHSRDITVFYEDKWYESAFSTVAAPQVGQHKKAERQKLPQVAR